MKAKDRSLLATVLLVGCVVLLLSRHSLLAANPVGIAFQELAALLMVWARLAFGVRSVHATANPAAGGLVTSGRIRTGSRARCACHRDDERPASTRLTRRRSPT